MSIRVLRLTCAATTLALLPVAAALAQPRDQRTYFTFSQAVQIPGADLPAGTYLFRLADTDSNRHIVQVMNEDGSKMIRTIMTIPAQRLDAPEKPEIRFLETPASAPAPIKTWWYPGRTIGHEFIWPREQALKLAARTKQPVLTTDPGVIQGSGFPKDGELERVDEAGKGTDVKVSDSPQATAVSGTAQSGRTDAQDRTAQDRTSARTPATTTATDGARDRDALPATASSLPLVTLIGLVSLMGAILLRARHARA
jgi:hypothetical protein